MVMAPAKTGRDKTNKNVVRKTLQMNSGKRSKEVK
jgi:hypothetical protein